MANKLKELWASGGCAVNAWISMPCAFSAEVMASCGFDSATVDLQHGVQDYLSMVACFQAMAAHPVTPLVRVPWREAGIVGKVLDAGAMGLICPMVNSRAEAEELGRGGVAVEAGSQREEHGGGQAVAEARRGGGRGREGDEVDLAWREGHRGVEEEGAVRPGQALGEFGQKFLDDDLGKVGSAGGEKVGQGGAGRVVAAQPVAHRDDQNLQLRSALKRAIRAEVEESCRPTGAPGWRSGRMPPASTLPSSTPHWS